MTKIQEKEPNHPKWGALTTLSKDQFMDMLKQGRAQEMSWTDLHADIAKVGYKGSEDIQRLVGALTTKCEGTKMNTSMNINRFHEIAEMVLSRKLPPGTVDGERERLEGVLRGQDEFTWQNHPEWKSAHNPTLYLTGKPDEDAGLTEFKMASLAKDVRSYLSKRPGSVKWSMEQGMNASLTGPSNEVMFKAEIREDSEDERAPDRSS